MRCRLILKTPTGTYKFASLYFSDYEPSFYIDFPYLKGIGDKFLASKMISKDGGRNLIYKKDNCYFLNKTPKLSYHLSGQVHIKNSVGEKIPGLAVSTKRLDDSVSTRFLDIVLKKPSACTVYNPIKDTGTENEKNLIIDTENINPETIELRGTRVVLDNSSPWFNEVRPNHPIIGSKTNPFTGENTPAIFFCFKPTSEHARVLFCFDIDFEKKFYCDEEQLLMVRSGFVGEITDEDYCELQIAAPRDSRKMIYID